MTHEREKLATTTKLVYGVGDVGNAMVNSAIQFFLMLFYTDGALIAPALPLAIAVMLLWSAPGGMGPAWAFVWIVGTFMFYDTMNTLTSVPYYALTAELTQD